MTNFFIFHAAKTSACREEYSSGGKKPPRFYMPIKLLTLLLIALILSGCAMGGGKRSGKSYVIKGKRYYILSTAKGFKEKGVASWYGEPFHGRRTSSGEVYDMNKISAAHKTLPMHTWVRVINLENKKEMSLRINDRGPFIDGRVIDLSRAAAQQLGVYRKGTARVRIEAITGDKARRLAAAEAQRNARIAAQQKKGKASKKPVKKRLFKIAAKASYKVELAINANPELAERLVSELRREYNAVTMYIKQQQGGELQFCVAVTNLGTMEAAANLRNRLSKSGYGRASLMVASN